MKKEIHPEYYKAAAVHCACGATFTVGSTLKKVEIEICSACHPFFSGADKVIDTAGRVEKFKNRRLKAGTETKPKKKTVVKAKSSRAKVNDDNAGFSTLAR